MSNRNTVGSRVRVGALITLLLAVSGLASCGGGESPSTTNTTTPTNKTTTIATPTYTITVTKNGGGTGTVSSASNRLNCGSICSEVFNAGIDVVLSAVPSGVSTFTSWGGACSGTGTTCTVTMTQASNVSATFILPTPQNNTLTVIKSGTGTGSVVSSTSGIDCGATCSASIASSISVTLTATPNTGSTFAGWSGACSGTGACTTPMSQARSVVASFTLIPTGGNAITLSLVPARTSGVAPLSVFFDASGTTDPSVTSRPFHDLEYRWNFGDTNAGTWNAGAQPGTSKNLAIGPVSAHVFETPGTYTVTMTLFDGTNTATTNTTITVSDPSTVFAGGNTVCFSTTANYTDCPAGATHVSTSNFATAINNYKASNRRLLFRRGETFSATSSAVLDVTGPGIIGAFGAGTSLPIAKLALNATFPIIQVSGPTTPGIGDWRIMDLDFDGSSVTTSSDVSGIATQGGFDNFLALRLNMHDIYRGVAAGIGIMDWWNAHGNPGHTLFKGWSVVDSRITGIPGCNWNGHYNCDWRIYISGTQVSVLGNQLDNQGLPNGTSGGSHVLRSEYLDHSVIANNDILRAGDFQHALKIHSILWQSSGVADPTGTGVASEKILISDNKIGGGPGAWTVSLGPQDEISNEHVRDIVFERNWITSGSGSQIGIETSVSDSTFRNNIFDMTGAAYHTGVSISRRGIEPVPNNDRIYNNTIYSGSTGDYEGVHVGTATNTTVQNNLGSAPLASGPVMISGTANTQSNNVLNNSPSALFVNASPTVPMHFGLKPLPNPARDTGLSTVSVLSDFFGTSRPQNSVIDIGAFEGP